MDQATVQTTVTATLVRIDEAWTAFRERVHAVPGERLELRIGDGWTRKQMLAHISAWHDLTTDRLAVLLESGEPAGDPEPEDVVNARAARAAVGRTTGEILIGMDDSYRRLRREVSRLTDEQLAAHDGWAAAIIAGNSHEHYAEHLADLDEASR
jgi:gamma-glutamyl:cysteine ligase YbdK (ATP-grasp superfamily)